MLDTMHSRSARGFWVVTIIVGAFMALGAVVQQANTPGELAVGIVAFDSPKPIRKWLSTSYKDRVFFPLVTAVVPGQHFYLAALVTGYGINSKGKTELTGDYRDFRPDGSIFHDEPNLLEQMVRIKPGQEMGFLMLKPTPMLEAAFDDEAQRGVYVFTVTVRDHVTNQMATGEYRIALKDPKDPK